MMPRMNKMYFENKLFPFILYLKFNRVHHESYLSGKRNLLLSINILIDCQGECIDGTSCQVGHLAFYPFTMKTPLRFYIKDILAARNPLERTPLNSRVIARAQLPDFRNDMKLTIIPHRNGKVLAIILYLGQNSDWGKALHIPFYRIIVEFDGDNPLVVATDLTPVEHRQATVYHR